MKSLFRRLHRWLGLAMALQIVAWMVSGLYFSIFPIETIRGEHLTREPATLAGADLSQLIPAAQAASTVSAALGPAAVTEKVSLQIRDEAVYIRVSGTAGNGSFSRLVDGRTGRLVSRLDADAARGVAQSALVRRGIVEGVDWVDSAPPGSEFRGRPLPLWRVRFSEPESLNLYIEPWTGDIAARRTARWRLFDFLWMLHVMDFDERDDFNTPLLQAAAALGLLVALSGPIFWAMTTRLLRRRRQRLSGPAG
jgi:uncharacterized iron-regulated membrane protein